MKQCVAILAVILATALPGTAIGQANKAGCMMCPASMGEGKQKGWLGVSISDLNDERAKRLNSKTTSGAVVRDIVDDSPAEEAGIQDGDVIVEFNGKPIADADDLSSAVRSAKPGDTVNLVLYRDDQKKSLKVKVGTYRSELAHLGITVPDVPPVHVEVFGRSEIDGLKVMTLNSQLGEYFGAPYGKGVLVERVKGKSPAAKAGFKAGDVILKLGDEEIEGTDDLYTAMEEYEQGDTATFRILRKGTNLTLAMMVTDRDDNPMRLFRREFHRVPKAESESYWFDSDTFRQNMKKMRQELKSAGEQVRIKMLDLKKRLEREFRQVGT